MLILNASRAPIPRWRAVLAVAGVFAAVLTVDVDVQAQPPVPPTPPEQKAPPGEEDLELRRPPPPPPIEAKDLDAEKKALEGSWRVVACEEGGKPLRQFGISQFTFKAGRVTVGEGSTSEQYGYTLDLAQRPKQLVLAARTSAGGKKLLRVAYSLEGDRLVICFDSRPDMPAPNALETKEGDGRLLATLKRVPPRDDGRVPGTAPGTPSNGERLPGATAQPSPPSLLEPRTGAVLPNGSREGNRTAVWEFKWSAVPGASKYHLQVIAAKARIPRLDRSDLTSPEYRDEWRGYVIDPNRLGWRWKVRALVGDVWTEWSEERTFDVQPLVPPGPYVVGKLDPADVAAILELVRGTPENVDRRILRIVVEKPDQVAVWTGVQPSPKAGRGSTIHLEKVDGKWKIVRYGRWIS